MTSPGRIAVDSRRFVADRSARQKHVWRAHIILATAEGCGTAEIMRRSGKNVFRVPASLNLGFR